MSASTHSNTSKFSTFFTNLDINSIPLPIRQIASSILLDTLGCLHEGAFIPISRQIRATASIFGGPGEASVAGSRKPVGTAQALYVNARLANLLDLDETFPIGTHFGVAAVCASIAALESTKGENQEIQGAELLVAIVAGYEAAARVATAIGPIIKVEDGDAKDYAKTWGVAAPVVVAGCVAYARALGRGVIDASGLEQALGIAVSNIPLPIANRWSDSVDAADCKYCDAGWCAVTGMHGVISALNGLTGFADIFDGDNGLPEAYGAQMPRPESLIEQLGDLWYLADTTFKPWPTCRWIHAPQTALRRILRHHSPLPENVEEVVVMTNPMAYSGLFQNPKPSTLCGYSFSYQHAIAMMLLGVTPGSKWFDPEIAESPAALALRKLVKIEILTDAGSFARDMIRNQIRTMLGAITVKTTQGDSWTERVDYSDGDPWDPETAYDHDRVTGKFRSLTDSPNAERLLEWISNLEERTTLDPLLSFIRECGIA